MFALVVRFDLDPAAGAEFDELMARTVAAIRDGEPGTHIYICCRVEGEPHSRVFMEVYTDRAAFEAHERTPATMRFLAERTSMIVRSRVEWLEPYESKIAPPV